MTYNDYVKAMAQDLRQAQDRAEAGKQKQSKGKSGVTPQNAATVADKIRAKNYKSLL